jgi:hypothetical protein
MKHYFYLWVLFCLGCASTGLTAQTPENCGEGTKIALAVGGGTEAFTCAGDQKPDRLTFKTGTFYLPYVLLLTDEEDNILDVYKTPAIDFEKYAVGNYRVWALYYKGQLLAQPGMNAKTDSLANYCFGLTDNFVRVVHFIPDGGVLSFKNGDSPHYICANENTDEVLMLQPGSKSPVYRYVLTDVKGTILKVFDDTNISLRSLPLGVFHFYGLSYGGTLNPSEGKNIDSFIFSNSCFDLSDNYLSIIKTNPDGGSVALPDGKTNTFVCGNLPDISSRQLKTNTESPALYTYLLTDAQNKIIQILPDAKVDFNGLQTGEYRVWGLSYIGKLTAEVGKIATGKLSTACSDLSDNFIRATVYLLDAGKISTNAADTSTTVCLNDPGATLRSYLLSTKGAEKQHFIITDLENRILALSPSSTINFSNIPGEYNRVWGATYIGNIQAKVGDKLFAVSFADSCYSITTNAINIRKRNPDGGRLQLSDGTTAQLLCFTSGIPQTKLVATTGGGGDNYVYLITDRQNNVVSLYPNNGQYHLADLPAGEYRVYGLSYTGKISFSVGTNIRTGRFSDQCFDFSQNFITFTKSVNDGGKIQLADGGARKVLCGVSKDSSLMITTSTLLVQNYVYLVTDTFNRIVSISTSNQVRILGADEGYFRIWGLGYSGELIAKVGESAASAELSSQCWDLSDSYVQVIKRSVDAGQLSLTNPSTALICFGQNAPESISLQNSPRFIGDNYALIITDTLQRIVAISNGLDFRPSKSFPNNFRVYGVAYTGKLNATIGNRVGTISSDECFDLSDNFVRFRWNEVDGGLVSLSTGATERLVCIDATADQMSFRNTGTAPTSTYRYLLTDDQDRLLLVLLGNSIDLNAGQPGKCRIWGLSYSGSLQLKAGDIVTAKSASDACFDLSNNFIAITKEQIKGGTIAFSTGNSPKFVCKAGKPDTLNWTRKDTQGSQLTYLITDAQGNILRITDQTRLFFDEITRDTARIYSMAYTGTLTAKVGLNINRNPLSDACFNLSNALIAIKTNLQGGLLRLSNGRTDNLQCPSAGSSSTLRFQRVGSLGDKFVYLITNNSNKIIAATSLDSFNFGNLPGGTYRVWGLAYGGQLLAMAGQDALTDLLADDCSGLSFNYITVNRQIPLGGKLSLIGGGVKTYVCPSNKQRDSIEWQLQGNQEGSIAYLITNADNTIRAITSENNTSLDSFPTGKYRIWGLVYNGDLLAKVGQKADQVQLSTSCFSLSENFLDIEKVAPEAGTIEATGIKSNICSGDGTADVATITRKGQNSAPQRLLITDDKDKLISILPDTAQIDFEKVNGANIRVYGLAYTGKIIIKEGYSVRDSAITDDCYDLSDNFIAVQKSFVDGARISTQAVGDSIYVCGNDGKNDTYTFSNNSKATEAGYRYVITNASNLILSIVNGNSPNLDLRGFRDLRVYGVSFSGNFTLTTNRVLQTAQISDGCSNISDNFLSVFIDVPDGGRISASNDSTNIRFCPGKDGTSLRMKTTSRSRAGFVYVLTTTDTIVRQIVRTDRIDLSNEPEGSYLIFGLSYTGIARINIGKKFNVKDTLANNCFDLADNVVRVIRGGEVEGGRISTPGGESIFYACPGDGFADAVPVFPPDVLIGQDYRIVITDDRNRVLFPDVESILIDFDRSPAGTYRIWGVSHTGEFRVQFGQDLLNSVLSTDCYDLSENFFTVVVQNPKGGTISTATGATELSITRGDNKKDVVRFTRKDAAPLPPYRYLVTDEQNVIRSIIPADSLNFDTLPQGVFRVWGLSYTGNLLAKAGLDADTADLADNCFQLSSNFVKITLGNGLETPKSPELQLNAPAQKTAAQPSMLLNIYPNPTKVDLYLNFENHTESNARASVRIMHPTGTVLKQLSLDAIPGKNATSLNVQNMPIGWYLLEVQLNGERQVVKWMKQD